MRSSSGSVGWIQSPKRSPKSSTAKSPYTYRHSANVAALARGIGRQMGVGDLEERRLVRAGLLHDIGKLGVSNRILDKPGRLTDEERTVVERHPLYTMEILERVSAFEELLKTAAYHHERLDGSGYPWRLAGSQLDAAARTLAVANVYEALTADRPYRAPLTPDAALHAHGAGPRDAAVRGGVGRPRGLGHAVRDTRAPSIDR